MTVAPHAKTWLWQAWLAATVFVFPIPHTIALRNLLLLVGILALLYGGRRALPQRVAWLTGMTLRDTRQHESHARFPSPPAPLPLAGEGSVESRSASFTLIPAAWCLAALTAWIALHSLAVAPDAAAALDQLRANWLLPLLIGGIAAWAACQISRAAVSHAVIAALAAHLLWLLEWQFALWLASGHWPFKATPFGAYDYHGTINGFFLALLVADRLVLLLERYSPLALGRHLGWFLLALSLLSDIALQSRNSTLISLFLLLIAGLWLLNSRSRHWRAIALAAGMVVLIGLGSLQFDKRWQDLRESAVAGWTVPGMQWTNLTATDPATWPLTPSGRRVEESAYMRAAWARKAVDFIARYPLGIGFGHDAFGRAMAREHGHAGMGSSHSGWLDFALGTGLAGLALLLATAFAAIRGAWLRWREARDGQALLFGFFVAAYLLRCLLDGHLSGWRLGLFAFVCGVLVATMKPAPQRP